MVYFIASAKDSHLNRRKINHFHRLMVSKILIASCLAIFKFEAILSFEFDLSPSNPRYLGHQNRRLTCLY
jgi:hypothetical protein